MREKTGHAPAGARQWLPAEDIGDPVKSLGLRFRTKGELAIDILAASYLDGLSFDFVCGDEVYGACTALREYLEERGQAYVLGVASNFTLTLTAGTAVTCAEAVKKPLGRKRTGKSAPPARARRASGGTPGPGSPPPPRGSPCWSAAT